MQETQIKQSKKKTLDLNPIEKNIENFQDMKKEKRINKKNNPNPKDIPSDDFFISEEENA
jgi:hypothetical protein